MSARNPKKNDTPQEKLEVQKSILAPVIHSLHAVKITTLKDGMHVSSPSPKHIELADHLSTILGQTYGDNDSAFYVFRFPPTNRVTIASRTGYITTVETALAFLIADTTGQ
jgi:hypothetical protein